ncbi:MAG: calcium-binding protein [Pikeienuella sp.]
MTTRRSSNIATNIPVGPEFQVNATTEDSQAKQSVAALSKGGFVVIWESADGSNIGVFGQRYDANGDKAGAEFQVNTYTAGAQKAANVTTLSGGGFVVSWESTGQDGSGGGVFAQRYNRNGDRVGGEFQVNDQSADHQKRPAMAGQWENGFVAAWESRGEESDAPGTSGVFAQRYDKHGDKVKGPFQVNTETADNQTEASMAMLSDGGFVVSWLSNLQDGDFNGVFAQRYNKIGDKLGGEFRVNATTDGSQVQKSVAALSDGGFIVTWISLKRDGGGVFAQRYDARSAKVGGEFRVNDPARSGEGFSNVTELPDGGFLITWQYATSPGELGAAPGIEVYARRFDKNGKPTGAEFQIGASAADNQETPRATALTNGDYLVTWTSSDEGGFDSNVTAQIFRDNRGSTGAVKIIGEAREGKTLSAETSALADEDGLGPLAYAWLRDGAVIGGATGARYTLTGADLGANVSLQVSYTDGNGTQEEITSSPTRISPVGRPTVGDDTLKGGAGDDRFNGGRGDDNMKGGAGHDTLAGNDGDDVMLGDAGRDRLFGGAGNDTMKGGAYADFLSGGAGDDLLKGDGGKDVLKGDAGRDVLKGGGGADKLKGGAGADKLNGGAGNDILIGGGGGDRFQFSANGGDDVIRDFQNGRDGLVILSGANRFADLDISDTARGALIEFGRSSVLLLNVEASQLDASDFIF